MYKYLTTPGNWILLWLLSVLCFPFQAYPQNQGSRNYPDLVRYYFGQTDSSFQKIAGEYVDHAVRTGTDRDKADAYHFFGLSHIRDEDNSFAIGNFLSEEALRKKLGDEPGLADCYYYLGDCYRAIFDPASADSALNQAIRLYRKLNNLPGIAKTLNRQAAIAIDFYDQNRFDEGYKLAQESQEITEKIKDYDLQVNNLILMGAVMIKKSRFEDALTFQKQALEVQKKAKEKFQIALILSNISYTYRESGQYDEALFYGKQAWEAANQYGKKVYIWLSGLNVSIIYDSLSQTDSFNKYRARALQARVDLIDEMRDKQKSMIEKKYTAIQHERELNYQVKQRQMVLLILVLLLVIGILTYTILTIRYRKLSRLNKALSDQNRVISDQKKELSELSCLKDRFYSIIAHDLRSPFNSILGLSEVLNDELKSEPRLHKICSNLNQSAERLYSLLENLLQWAQFQQGALPFKPEQIPLAYLVKSTLETSQDITDKKQIHINLDIPDPIYVFADSQMTGAILRNLLSNALKFTPSGGSVTISARQTDESTIQIQVKDTGIGIPFCMLDQLFSPEKSHRRPGTEGEPSSGLGLIICREFLEKNGGSISVASEEGSGSTFTLTLPTR